MIAKEDLKAEALAAARKANGLGLTQSTIAEGTGASQSQVSRVLSGKSVRRSRLFDEVCKYVFSFDEKRPDVAKSHELTRALADVWDGTDGHAKALALVIRSLGALGTAAPVARSRSAVKRGATK